MKKFINKLLPNKEEYFKVPSKPLIIAIDFDGTCVRDAYPEIGEDMPGVVHTLHSLLLRDHKLILWTCREGEQLSDAVEWFKEKDLLLFGVNETPLDDDFRKGGGRKVFADLYIDDRNFGGFPGWAKVHQELLGMPLIGY